jgi:hypothetical protein
MTFEYKSNGGRNFHKVAQFADVSICAVMKNTNLLPVSIINDCIQRFPTLCHICPFVKGSNLTIDFTYPEEYCPNKKNIEEPIFVNMAFYPDGDYRISVNVKTADDEVGVAVVLYARVNLGDKNSF